MLGQMMGQPLLTSMLLQHVERHHADREIVSRHADGALHRYQYRQMAARARRLAAALGALGVGAGQRVATLAWNGYRHLELYHAVPGMGAVLHTINPRLHSDQIAYMAVHAQDQIVFFDLGMLPAVQQLASRCSAITRYVAMCAPEQMPADCGIDGLLCYEDLIAAHDEIQAWPLFDEQRASLLCYTSGTTGNPKGVLYSHRSTVLHAMAAALPDSMHISARDTILVAVPMFHVNAWGIPYAACIGGAALVLPGPKLDGESIAGLLNGERVSFAAGVPTIWQGVLGYLENGGKRLAAPLRVLIGGAACPTSLVAGLQDRHGVQVTHAWGMTELSPLGTIGIFKASHAALDAAQRRLLQLKQGRAVFGMDMKIVDPQGEELAWGSGRDGDLMVRGPWVVARYFNDAVDALENGWFATGDVATIDADGFMQITDRSKDVIKSGGEWIGSIALEDIAMSHPAVALAACIAVPHPKWDERPVLVVQLKSGVELSREEMLRHFDGKIAKWWIPDDVVFVAVLPVSGTGKILKGQLRSDFRDYRLPQAGGGAA